MRSKPLVIALILAGLLLPLALFAFSPADATWKQPFDESALPLVRMSAGAQFAALASLFIIKPAYMLLCLGLLLILLRQKSRDLRLLGLSLSSFLAGEVACAINYIFLSDRSNLAEYLHSASMALAFGLLAYALLEGLDERVLHFSAPAKKCALLEVCGPCVKYQPVPCGVRKLALLGLPTLLVLTIIPWQTRLSEYAYHTSVLGFAHFYQRALPIQTYEARFIPAASFILFAAAWLALLLTPKTPLHPIARVLTCAGLGLWGFGMFRVVLGLLFAHDLVWFYFWEEATELLFILAVIYILWNFRKTLLSDNHPRIWNE